MGYEVYCALSLLFGLAVLLVALAVSYVLRNPFEHPYFELDFDVSRRRNVHIDDLVNKWLCAPGSWEQALGHHRQIEA